MGIGQPGVEGKARHFEGKAQEETPEDKAANQSTALFVGNIHKGSRRCSADNVECAGCKVGGQNGQQHCYRADQGVDKELDRGIAAILTTPDADQAGTSAPG